MLFYEYVSYLARLGDLSPLVNIHNTTYIQASEPRITKAKTGGGGSGGGARLSLSLSLSLHLSTSTLVGEEYSNVLLKRYEVQ